MTRILVYGSLRKGEGANRFLLNTEFVKEVRVPGYDLFHLGWYPGIKPNSENEEGFVGEVYQIQEWDNETLQNLDAYEGYRKNDEPNSLFIRKEIEVEGKPTFVYVYNGRTDSGVGMKIPNGDWSSRNG